MTTKHVRDAARFLREYRHGVTASCISVSIGTLMVDLELALVELREAGYIAERVAPCCSGRCCASRWSLTAAGELMASRLEPWFPPARKSEPLRIIEPAGNEEPIT